MPVAAMGIGPTDGILGSKLQANLPPVARAFELKQFPGDVYGHKAWQMQLLELEASPHLMCACFEQGTVFASSCVRHCPGYGLAAASRTRTCERPTRDCSFEQSDA